MVGMIMRNSDQLYIVGSYSHQLQLSRHGLRGCLEPMYPVDAALLESVWHRRDNVVRARIEHHPRVAVLNQMRIARNVDGRAGWNQHVFPSLRVPGVPVTSIENVEPVRKTSRLRRILRPEWFASLLRPNR